MDYYRDKGRKTFCSMFSSPPPAVQYHGLHNQGATCYLNSVLQVLFMTEDFRAAVERHCCENPSTECIDCQLKDLFDDLKGQTADTYNITKKLGISRVYEQQDAAEYYEKILNLTSPDASQIFHGWLTDRTTCSGCGTETDADGPFWHLPLALVDSHSEHYSVVDGIEEHFRASEFSGQNQMYCEECDAKCDATIQCVMKHHPEVLMLLLKRFDFDYRYMTYVKINQTADVPRILQIPENQTYELYAVVDHSGDLRSGHYSVSIWDDENWFNFNDSRVTLAYDQPFQDANFKKSRSAYLLFYRKQNATQTTRPVSAPGGHLPATGDIYDQCQDLGKKRGREECEAINGDEETERVRSRVELQPDPRYYGNDQDTIPSIHQVCYEERNDKNHLQDAQADEHRDEVETPTGDEGGMRENAEAENQAEEMEPCRVTQHEESVDDQDSGEESAQDVSNDLKPEISGMLAKDAHLRKEVDRSDEETGEMDLKTGEEIQSEKEEKSLTNYPEDNARENVDENLTGTQEVGQHKNKPASENEQREERGLGIDDKEGKTEAGEGASEIGRLNYDLFSSEIQDYGRDGSRKQNMPKEDHQQGEERMDVQQAEEQKTGDDKVAQRTDTSVTECYPSEGVLAQDSDGLRRDDVSVHPEQKIGITPTIQKDVELDKKGKTRVHDKGPTNLLTKYDHPHSSEIQDDRRVDYNKQKVPKDDQRCREGGSSRRKRHEQEREVRTDVEGVMEQKRGDSGQPHKRSDSSLRREGSAGSSKPTECQGAGCGKKVRRSNSRERPGWKSIKDKKIDKEIHSETETSAEDNLPKRIAKLNLNDSSPTESNKSASKKAVPNVQEEETNRANKRKFSDTEDQETNQGCFCGLSRLLKKKPRESGKKKKQLQGVSLLKRRGNADSK